MDGAPVNPHGVPSLQVPQGAVAHVTLGRRKRANSLSALHTLSEVSQEEWIPWRIQGGGGDQHLIGTHEYVQLYYVRGEGTQNFQVSPCKHFTFHTHTSSVGTLQDQEEKRRN